MNKNQNLIVDENTIYEIDPECLKKKREQQEERKEKDVRLHLESAPKLHQDS